MLSVTLFFYDILKILECVFKEVSFNSPMLLSVQNRKDIFFWKDKEKPVSISELWDTDSDPE